MKMVLKKNRKNGRLLGIIFGSIIVLLMVFAIPNRHAEAEIPADADFHDAHFHLTNYVQQGTNMKDFVDMMDSKIGRSTVFGIPLQQQWSYSNTGDWAPVYYLQTDAPLYYYSYTDAHIAMAYRSLAEEDQARLDPMITGFNPSDMYAAEHIRRVLEDFPGVFSGIGEFTIHKEFVSSKVAGEIASLTNPALDKILDFAGKVGLVVIIHNDVDMQPRPDQDPYMLPQLKELLARHPDTTIIWAHMGVGRIVRPHKDQAAIIEKICTDPSLQHVYLDLSWMELAKYIMASPQTIKGTADMINRYPDRFLFGTDVVAPKKLDDMVDVYDAYAPLWAVLTPESSAKVRKGNYERLFDEANLKVRAWEKENAAGSK